MKPTLLSPDGLSGLIFLALVAVTVAGALVAVAAQRLVRGIAGLSLCFIGVAGLYYFLNSPFVAMMELLIYVGAVCVAIAFAIMLAEPRSEDKVGKTSGLGAVFGVIVGGLAFLGLALAGRHTHWAGAPSKLNSGSITEVGKALLTSYSLVFELISVVLLVAIIGALVLAQSGRDK
ncbi:MAG: NADH-quinone oxidoreductase subunit J [Desulfobacteraceae bacterium]|nr:NADH-quinone oxidoreductase subunit J [Desulfobacteraceae bacterium]